MNMYCLGNMSSSLYNSMSMFIQSPGEIIALGAVAGWTVSALAFEAASRRIGSVPVNTIRMVMAALILILINAFRGLPPWPAGIDGGSFMWLIASGLAGFFIGDLLLFRSYLIIGSRMAMLIMSLSPPVSALLDWLVFGTSLTLGDAAGMLLTMGGVTLALSGKNPRRNPDQDEVPRISRPFGALLAFGGALGQSGGMILAKLGMSGRDALSATFVRTLGGIAGFLAVVLIKGASGRIRAGLRSTPAMLQMTIGAVAGPVLGVSAVLLAMNYSPAGVVSAIIAVIPVVIILPSVLLLKDKIRLREVIGAAAAAAGVILLILT